jgi:hypothetical protein
MGVSRAFGGRRSRRKIACFRGVKSTGFRGRLDAGLKMSCRLRRVFGFIRPHENPADLRGDVGLRLPFDTARFRQKRKYLWLDGRGRQQLPGPCDGDRFRPVPQLQARTRSVGPLEPRAWNFLPSDAFRPGFFDIRSSYPQSGRREANAGKRPHELGLSSASRSPLSFTSSPESSSSFSLAGTSLRDPRRISPSPSRRSLRASLSMRIAGLPSRPFTSSSFCRPVCSFCPRLSSTGPSPGARAFSGPWDSPPRR